MPDEPHANRRRSVRLRHFDYTSQNAYFITLCAADRRCMFGRVDGDVVLLGPLGRIAEDCWQAIPEHFPTVELDCYVVMPHHVHGIVLLFDGTAGTACRAPTTAPRAFGQATGGSLATIIGAYKSAVTRHANTLRRSPGRKLWQRNYYEHIIRDERELAAVRRYIEENPLRWSLDRENPDASDTEDDLPWESET